jgi:hypothetical protein
MCGQNGADVMVYLPFLANHRPETKLVATDLAILPFFWEPFFSQGGLIKISLNIVAEKYKDKAKNDMPAARGEDT